MANMMHFDTHQFARKLKTAGFAEDQVDTLIELAVESTPKDLATKQDLTAFEQRHKADMTVLEHRLTLKIGGMIVGAVAIFAAIGRFLPSIAS